jgi:hypothetical protein
MKKVILSTCAPLALIFASLSYAAAPPINVDKEFSILSHKAPKLDRNALKAALIAYQCAALRGQVQKPVLTVIDFGSPSTKERLFTFDLEKHKLLFHTLVAHGKNTGGLMAKHFSNKHGSKASSIGVFVTENTYIGSKGYSLRLNGLERGYNDQAKSRAVVMHGAWYASKQVAKSHGEIGRSWGCPAIPPEYVGPVISTIKDGSVVFSYYPDPQWLKRSKFLNCQAVA